VPFIRIRDSRTGYEVDVNPARLESHKEFWTVVDPELVAVQRPATVSKKRVKAEPSVPLSEKTKASNKAFVEHAEASELVPVEDTI